MKIISIIILWFLSGEMAQEGKSPAKTLPVYNFAQLEPLLHPPASNDTVFLFNFWATFCAPCIEELPYFDRAVNEFAGKPLKVTLVSLDFKSAMETRVIPFISRHNIRSKVVVLNDPDANNWINKVNPAWSGAIPATLVVKGNRREFYEKAFKYDELKLVINKFLEK